VSVICSYQILFIQLGYVAQLGIREVSAKFWLGNMKGGDNSGELSIRGGIMWKGMLKTGFVVVHHIEVVHDMVCHRAYVIMAMNIWIVWNRSFFSSVSVPLKAKEIRDMGNFFLRFWPLQCIEKTPFLMVASCKMKMRSLRLCETSSATRPMTLCRILEDLNLLQHYCENLKSCID